MRPGRLKKSPFSICCVCARARERTLMTLVLNRVHFADSCEERWSSGGSL